MHRPNPCFLAARGVVRAPTFAEPMTERRVKTLLRTPLLAGGCIALAAVTAACDPGGDVVVEPLPPLERPSPEARLGLPELAGPWRLAGGRESGV